MSYDPVCVQHIICGVRRCHPASFAFIHFIWYHLDQFERYFSNSGTDNRLHLNIQQTSQRIIKQKMLNNIIPLPKICAIICLILWHFGVAAILKKLKYTEIANCRDLEDVTQKLYLLSFDLEYLMWFGDIYQ